MATPVLGVLQLDKKTRKTSDMLLPKISVLQHCISNKLPGKVTVAVRFRLAGWGFLENLRAHTLSRACAPTSSGFGDISSNLRASGSIDYCVGTMEMVIS